MKLDPKYNERPDDPDFFDMKMTPLTEEEATYYLREGWYELHNSYPSNNTLAILWAQTALETGRWSMLRNYNFGNIKRRSTIPGWTSYEAGEFLDLGEGVKHYMFYPYHPQTHFSAWPTATDGAHGYIEFLLGRQRYQAASVELIAGDPVGYCRELRKGGYFTAPLDKYTASVVKLFNEFHSKSNKLLAWRPAEPEPEPELEENSSVIEPAPEPEQNPTLEPTQPEKKPLGLLEAIISFLKNLL